MLGNVGTSCLLARARASKGRMLPREWTGQGKVYMCSCMAHFAWQWILSSQNACGAGILGPSRGGPVSTNLTRMELAAAFIAGTNPHDWLPETQGKWLAIESPFKP